MNSEEEGRSELQGGTASSVEGVGRERVVGGGEAHDGVRANESDAAAEHGDSALKGGRVCASFRGDGPWCGMARVRQAVGGGGDVGESFLQGRGSEEGSSLLWVLFEHQRPCCCGEEAGQGSRCQRRNDMLSTHFLQLRPECFLWWSGSALLLQSGAITVCVFSYTMEERATEISFV